MTRLKLLLKSRCNSISKVHPPPGSLAYPPGLFAASLPTKSVVTTNPGGHVARLSQETKLRSPNRNAFESGECHFFRKLHHGFPTKHGRCIVILPCLRSA